MAATNTEVDVKMLVFLCIVTVILVFIGRIYWVLVRRQALKKEKVEKLVKTMIVMGSGGHTKEMLTLLTGLSSYYYPRIYIVADTDNMSAEKIKNFEKENKYEFEQIPRSREVHQSWSSTVLTTFKSFLFSFPLVFRHKPELILCNGPGTCIPICLAAFILKVLGIQAVSVVYIESICRVETLSLSAKILYYFADQILVQWKQLETKYPRTLYCGRLVPIFYTPCTVQTHRPLSMLIKKISRSKYLSKVMSSRQSGIFLVKYDKYIRNVCMTCWNIAGTSAGTAIMCL